MLCHGYAGENARKKVCMDAGGMGLQLGSEGLMHSNVSLWKSIYNKVQNIVIYSCAASNTEHGDEGSTADGRYLMGALATYTNASVYAADRIQWYIKDKIDNNIDFGDWEGTLWCFTPHGIVPPLTVSRAPIELGDVLSGAA